eukprot:g678.t1
MRFRAKLSAGPYEYFRTITKTLKDTLPDAACREACVLHLSDSRVRFLVKASNIGSVAEGGGLQAVAVLSTGGKMFSEYNIQSTRDGNAIALKVNLLQFLKALQSGTKAPEVTLRLTNNNGIPSLSIVARTTEICVNEMIVKQHVPVVPLTVNDAAPYEEPELSRPEISMAWNALDRAKIVCQAMQTLSKYMKIELKSTGIITLKIGNEGGQNIHVRTDFNPPSSSATSGNSHKPSSRTNNSAASDGDGGNTTNPSQSDDQSSFSTVQLGRPEDVDAVTRGEELVYRVDVDSRLLYQTLACHAITVDHAMACICAKKAFILYLTLPNELGYISFYLPVLNLQDDYLSDEEQQNDDGGSLPSSVAY